MFLLGPVVNALAVVVGTAIGRALPAISERIRTTVMQGLGLAVVLIGFGMAYPDLHDALILIFAMVFGALVGEWMDIESHLHAWGEALERRTRAGGGKLAEAFVAATLLFCVGSMAIVGAIESGLHNHHTTLFAKSMLDGFASVVFASTLGIGVIFSAGTVLLYEGVIAALAHFFGSSLSPSVIDAVSGAGGLLIVAIGLNLLGATNVKVGNLLPSLLMAGVARALQPEALGLWHSILSVR